MTLLYTSPVFLEHDTGNHPETAERLRAIERELVSTGLRERCTLASFEPIAAESLKLIHATKVIERARLMAESGGGRRALVEGRAAR